MHSTRWLRIWKGGANKKSWADEGVAAQARHQLRETKWKYAMYAHGIPRAALQDNRARTFSSQSGLERTAHGFFSFKSAPSSSCNVFFRIVSRGIPLQPFPEIRRACARAPRATIFEQSRQRVEFKWMDGEIRRNLFDLDDSLIIFFIYYRSWRTQEKKGNFVSGI